MRKKIINTAQQEHVSSEQGWLNLEETVKVELTSEDPSYPIESALLSDQSWEWRAAEPGKQTIRLLFDHPQRLQRISLNFVESHTERTQEYVLRWSPDDGKSFQDIVRQQWNFSPKGTSVEKEDHQVDLQGVTVLELIIIPDISGGDACASLAQLQLAS
jgi:hypothetical protein